MITSKQHDHADELQRILAIGYITYEDQSNSHYVSRTVTNKYGGEQ